MDIHHIKEVAIIGAGMMGHGIAQIFATHHYSVTLVDVDQHYLARAIETIRANLSRLAQRGIGLHEEIPPALERIRTTTEIEKAAHCQFIVEAVTENLALKQNLFLDLDALCPADTIIATNTSVMSITEIARKARLQERIVGTHFWNPPYLIPLVEVIRGSKTSSEAMEVTFDLLKRVGKHPVRVNKDVPGFIGNRLQHALWREAISIVEHGIADPASVDDVIKKGFGIRLATLGPLENADMVGLDLTLAIHDYILKHLEASPAPSPLLKGKVEQGQLGFKSGKGFFDWTPEETEKSRENLLNYLIDKIQKKET